MADNEAPKAPKASEIKGHALRYTGDGTQHVGGVPRRTLTAQEVADLAPKMLRELTTPHPGTGKALYVPVEPAKE